MRKPATDLATLKAAVTPAAVLAAAGYDMGPRNVLCCPFHAEKTPSLRLWDDHWYCFGCGAGGDVFDLAQRLHTLKDFHTAVQHIARLAGYEPGWLPVLDMEAVRRRLADRKARQDAQQAILATFMASVAVWAEQADCERLATAAAKAWRSGSVAGLDWLAAAYRRRDSLEGEACEN